MKSQQYNFDQLTLSVPELKKYLRTNPEGMVTIDFADPRAVKALNTALLKTQYGLTFWDVPEGHLCPPVPGRAEILRALAASFALPPKSRVLDIGVGANCIFPIIGCRAYGWSFVGTDVLESSLSSAREIVDRNRLDVELRLQKKSANIYLGILGPRDHFDLSVCNPPFHASAEEARAGTNRKWKNLGRGKGLNFSGAPSELWYPGGEKSFVSQMIRESTAFPAQVRIYSCLISKAETLRPLKRTLASAGAKDSMVIQVSIGNKKSRVLCWTFTSFPAPTQASR